MDKKQRDKSLMFAFLPKHETHSFNTKTHEVKIKANLPENTTLEDWIEVPKLYDANIDDLLKLFLKELGKLSEYDGTLEGTIKHLRDKEKEAWKELLMKWAEIRVSTWVAQYE